MLIAMVIIFGTSWFPINFINLLHDCIDLGTWYFAGGFFKSPFKSPLSGLQCHVGKSPKKGQKKTGLETFAEGAGKQLRKVNWWVAGVMTPNSNEAIEFSYCI